MKIGILLKSVQFALNCFIRAFQECEENFHELVKQTKLRLIYNLTLRFCNCMYYFSILKLRSLHILLQIFIVFFFLTLTKRKLSQLYFHLLIWFFFFNAFCDLRTAFHIWKQQRKKQTQSSLLVHVRIVESLSPWIMALSRPGHASLLYWLLSKP